MATFLKRIGLSTLCCLAAVTLSFGANGFATQRLQKMAAALSDIPFERLGNGTYHSFSHKVLPLTVRVNEWEEVDHIGLYLFDPAAVTDEQRLACDFVERYLLELELASPSERKLRMGIDKVSVEDGSLENIAQLKKSDRYEISKLEMRKYHIAWYNESRCLLALMFDMDYQLLAGCNAIELENNYLRDVVRAHHLKDVVMEKPVIESNDEYAIVDGGSYLSPSIRGDRYYRLDSISEWIPVCSTSKPYWSAANTVLSPILIGDFQLKCTLDMYGYKDASFQIDVNQWVAQTLREGCKLFFGIKSRTPQTIRGTLFCPNPSGGYCHMMSVEIPVEMFDQGRGVLEGRLYAYVPLHNIDQGYFDLNYMDVSSSGNDKSKK